MSESENRGPVRPGNQKPFDLPAGLVAAVGVHALLFVGLFTVFQWRTEPESFYAELWAPEDASGESVAGKAPETPDKPLLKDTEAAPQPDPQEDLAAFFGAQFGLEIKVRNCYDAYLDMKRRKNESRTYFLDKLRERLNLRMQRDDAKELARR